MILQIVKYPDKMLSTPTRFISETEIASKKIQQLIEDMIETCWAVDGLGLAANQVGEGVSVLVYNMPGSDDFGVLINPMISVRTGKMTSAGEGCLSLPDLFFTIKRARQITVSAFDHKGKPLIIKAKSKALSKLLQHEIDHLNGISLVDKKKRK